MTKDVLYAGRGLENIGWEPEVIPYERITIRIDEMAMSLDEEKIFQGLRCMLGHFEWELWTARMLFSAIQKAIMEGKSEADVTDTFSYKLTGWDSSGKYSKKAETLEKQLEQRIFEIIDESDEELHLQFQKF